MAEFSERIGIWYLPDKPENKLPGVLRFSPESGAELSVYGSFEFQERTEEILGQTDSGNISVYNCFVKAQRGRYLANDRMHSSQTILADIILEGACLKRHDVSITTSRILLNGLKEWALWARPSDFDEAVFCNIDIDDCNIVVRKFSSTTQSIYRKSRWIEVSVDFSYLDPIEVEKFLETVRLLEILFSILIGVPVFASQIDAMLDGDNTPIFTKSIHKRIYHTRTDLPHQPYIPLTYLEQYGDPEQFGRIIHTWFNHFTSSNAFWLNYYSVINKSGVDLSEDYIKLLRCLEFYYRSPRGKSPKLDKCFQQLRNEYPRFHKMLDSSLDGFDFISTSVHLRQHIVHNQQAEKDLLRFMANPRVWLIYLMRMKLIVEGLILQMLNVDPRVIDSHIGDKSSLYQLFHG